MVWLLIGVATLGAVLLAARLFVNADPQKLAAFIRLAGALALALLALRLMMVGNVAVAGPLGVTAVMLLRRWWGRRPAAMPGGGKAGGGRRSTVETDSLRMILDHDSGELDGEILRGPLAGRRLGEMSLAQLVEALDDWRGSDPEAAKLLESYLERARGADWRAHDRAAGGDKHGSVQGAGPMTRDQALAVLGLEAGAGPAAIKRAHRELMKKLHPDHGGSGYLAAKVNQARAVLLDD